MSTALLEHKYAPNTFDEMILNPDVRKKLEKALVELPNLMLIGAPGVGKGTFVDVLRKQTGIDCLKLNCSDETGIDSIREKVKTFATAVGFGGIKLVYLNEADYLSLNAQAMLRDLMESVQKVTRFILCCNYGHKMMDELCSRCDVIDLSNPPAVDVVKRCWYILDQEGVQYNKKTVAELVKTIWKRQPDIRKTIVTLKSNIIDGVLMDNITIASNDGVYQSVLDAMKTGDPSNVRTILKSNQVDYTSLYKYIYDAMMNSDDAVFGNDAVAILLIGEHSYRDTLVAIKEINFMHMYFEMLKGGVI